MAGDPNKNGETENMLSDRHAASKCSMYMKIRLNHSSSVRKGGIYISKRVVEVGHIS